MKKLLINESRRLGLLLLFCITVCMANAFEKDGIVYSFGRDNTLTIVKLSKDFAPVSLIIPERVEYESNTYEVTRIGMDAFSRCESLESVNLPETITSIEIGAFYGCKALKEVNIPRKVKNIESDTFSECSSLTTITLPYGLIWITSQAFEGCNKLMDITSLATFPPYIDEDSFPIFGTLHVRQGAKVYYENEDFWKNFNIVEDAVATDDMLESYIPFAEADKTWAMLNFDNSKIVCSNA